MIVVAFVILMLAFSCKNHANGGGWTRKLFLTIFHILSLITVFIARRRVALKTAGVCINLLLFIHI